MELDDGTGTNTNRNVREMAYIKSPNMSIYEYDDEGNLTGDYFTPINSYQGNGVTFFNPVAVSNLGRNDRNSNNLQNTFTLNYNITPWIRLRETVSFQFEGVKDQILISLTMPSAPTGLITGSIWPGKEIISFRPSIRKHSFHSILRMIQVIMYFPVPLPGLPISRDMNG